jgi:adenylate cyclase
MTEFIAGEGDSLFGDIMKLTRDEDLFLAQAAALFGRAWGTLNVQDEPLTGEQADRRALAERRFSYPVSNSGGIAEGQNADILAPVPPFAQAVKGAGFTNIYGDGDGVRRRVFLTQEVRGRWYLQLALAPLMESWGNPPVSVEPRRLIIEKEGGPLRIPLDAGGAMLLDWPPESYRETLDHLSFEYFSDLTDFESHIGEYLSALAFSNPRIFPALVEGAEDLLGYFEAAERAKTSALENCRDDAFEEYTALRDEGLEKTGEFLAALKAGNYIEGESRRIREALEDGDARAAVLEEAQYCLSLTEYLDIELNALRGVREELANRLRDKICIIGRVDTGTTDFGVNPFHGDYVNVGTHGIVLDTILRGSFITPLPPLWSALFAVAFAFLLLAGTSGLKTGLRSALGLGGVLLSAGLPFTLFVLKRCFLGPLGPLLAVGAGVILREAAAFVHSEREKQFIRRAFSTYLSAGVVEELIADPSKLNLGGEKREMTALFTDIQGFSTISEKLDPVQLVRLLNTYLTAMSDIIMENQGTIDKYEGDAIIAFFGAPLYRPDHAVLACRSALAMKRAEAELNKTVLEEKLSPLPVYTRIGINTGELVVGNMGTSAQMTYTIMGNAVHLAARLEGVNKQYHTGGILISEYTEAQAGGELLCRRLDRVRVVGVNTPLRLHELLAARESAGPGRIKAAETFNRALDLFEGRDWKGAAEGFREVLAASPGDKTAQLYLDRCAAFLTKPPEETWDGVYNLTEK